MTRSYAPRRDRREVGYLKRHVRLPGGPKVTQPKQISVKAASIAFAVRRDCELNMIDA